MFVKKCLVVAVAAGSMVLGGAGAAFADAAVGSDSHNSESRLSGNNANAAVNAPANVCGNGVGVLGFGTGAAGCQTGDNDGNRYDGGKKGKSSSEK